MSVGIPEFNLLQTRALPGLDHIDVWPGLTRAGNYGTLRDNFPTPLGGCQHIAVTAEDYEGEDTSALAVTRWGLNLDNTGASWSHTVARNSFVPYLPDTTRAWAQGDGRDDPYVDFNEALVGQEMGINFTDWRTKPDWYVTEMLQMSAAAWALWFVKGDWPMIVTLDRKRLVELLRRGESPGLTGHYIISPDNRSDPGRVREPDYTYVDTFPWNRLLSLIQDEKTIRLTAHGSTPPAPPEEEKVATSFNGLPVLMDYPSSAGRFYSPAPGFKEVWARSRPMAVLLEAVARRWNDYIGPIAVSHEDNWKRPRERHNKTLSGAGDLIGIHCYRPPGTTVGTGDLSNHRSGSALDINGHLHRWHSTPSTDNLSAAQIAELLRIKSDFTDAAGRPVLRLGIHFSADAYDPMHVETAPGVSLTRIAQAAEKLQDYVGRHSSANVWWRNAKGLDVMEFQQDAKDKGFAITWVDGKAGANTEEVIKAVQRATGSVVDGRVGDGTRLALRNYVKPKPTPLPEPTPAPVIPDPEPVMPNMDAYRISGSSRFGTAAAAALRQWPDGAEAVYLANAWGYSDQTAASGFKDGPVLLVGIDSLHESTREAIVTLAPKRVETTGGSSVVPDAVLYAARKAAGLEK